MPLNDRHTALLEARGLDVELLERLGVDSSQRGPDWIEIPYVERGKIVNRKYRTIAGEKRFTQDADAKKCFWNVDVVSDETLAGQVLIITEGELDAITAIQSGFVRTISVPDGAPAKELGKEGGDAKYSYVVDALPMLSAVNEIILATDNDEPGVALVSDLSLRLGRHRCKWLTYPKHPETCPAKDCKHQPGDRLKDLNEVLVHYGQKGVVETIARAQWIKVNGIYRMSDLPPIPRAQAFDIGIAYLDQHYKMRPGDLTVVTGIPSHGKTSFVNEIMCRMAQRYGWSVAVASFEQRPQVDHRRNLRTFHQSKRPAYQTPEELRAADEWIDRHFVFMVPDEDEDADLRWLIDKASAAIVQYGARLVIIDPWNEMDHVRPQDMSLTEYTGFAIKQFRKLASKYQVHVIVVAHPTKLARDKNGKLPIPSLYDISDSAHWANKSDVGIIIHRDGGETLIRVQKTRYNDEIGEPGDLKAVYLRDMARYDIKAPECER